MLLRQSLAFMGATICLTLFWCAFPANTLSSYASPDFRSGRDAITTERHVVAGGRVVRSEGHYPEPLQFCKLFPGIGRAYGFNGEVLRTVLPDCPVKVVTTSHTGDFKMAIPASTEVGVVGFAHVALAINQIGYQVYVHKDNPRKEVYLEDFIEEGGTTG